MNTSDCDPLEQHARARLIDDLARLDGRRDRSHPLHGFYTGLARPMTRIIQLEAELVDLKHQMAALCDQLTAMQQHQAAASESDG